MTSVATTTLVQGARASRSTIALKLLMAVSGIVFIGFVLLHMYGNLKVFAGHDAFNEYADHLRTFGEPMLPVRAACSGSSGSCCSSSLVVHVYCRGRAVAPRRPRPARVKYVVKKQHRLVVSLSRLMRWGGRDAAAVHHLAPAELHDRQGQRHGRRDQRPLQPAGRHLRHLVDDADLPASRWSRSALHLHHGIWSAAQTLGCTNTAALARRAPRARRSSLAVVIAGGFSLVPIFVLAGVITK